MKVAQLNIVDVRDSQISCCFFDFFFFDSIKNFEEPLTRFLPVHF